MSELTDDDLRERRIRTCVEQWPECESGMYDPRCCRFPKSCSPHGRIEAVLAGNLTDDDLEPRAAAHQPTLFDAARPHARRTDPYTSDQALKAIAKDGTLMHWIWWFADIRRDLSEPFNDTQLTEWIEFATGKRQQRNVVARSRGMLEDAGLLRQAGVREYEGRELVHYEIDPNNKKEQP